MKVEIKPKFQIVTPEEGYVLTNYKEGDDIRSYNSFMSCYCPLDCDHSHIREITAAEDAVLTAERDKVLEYDSTKEY
jgi:hypothetical protein